MEAHIRAGEADALTDDVSRLTGKPPRSFAQFYTDYASTFSD